MIIICAQSTPITTTSEHTTSLEETSLAITNQKLQLELENLRQQLKIDKRERKQKESKLNIIKDVFYAILLLIAKSI